MTWLVCDYGGVLSLDQSEADRAGLLALSGWAGSRSAFSDAYWRHRAAYDRADLAVAEYWTAVLGSALPAEQLRALVDLDVRSWCHPDPDALAATGRAGARGLDLAVLSNAPVEVARALDRLPWLAAFRPRLFSCDLHVVKPEAAIYRSVVDILGVAAADVVFFDDREDNVAAAAELGMEAHLFTEASQFDAVEP